MKDRGDLILKKQDETRIPVIIGVGQFNDRPARDIDGMDPIGLMMEALRRADRDAGGGWLGRVQSLGVVGQISFPEIRDIHLRLAEALGIQASFLDLTLPYGDCPVKLINAAANRIGAGEIMIAAATGAEALRTAAAKAAAQAAAGQKSTDLRGLVRQQAQSLKSKYGLETPTDIYPLYENGCRAAWGQTLSEAQAESAAIWSGMSKVADANPDAWLHTPMEPDEILAETPRNRPIAFPYRKLMVANSAVNQGAAVIIASLAEARRRRVPDDRLVYICPGAAAHEPDDILARDSYDDSPSMRVSIEKTLILNELQAADLDCVELYSCFPCVTKMARRVLGWPLEKPHSVYGGLTFGGGPIGNCMMHAAACMVEKIRRGANRGLIFANGGYATHNHAIVLSRTPPKSEAFPQSYDYQAEADRLRRPVPDLIEDYTGPGCIETYTVIYDRQGTAMFGTVIARTPAGERFICRVPKEDQSGIEFLTSGKTEPIGARGMAYRAENGYIFWKCEGA
jgi:acetyl-CoA C-acetyltransferase